MKRTVTLISIIGIGCGITWVLVFGHRSRSDAPNTSVVANTKTQQRIPLFQQETAPDSQETGTHDPEDFYKVIIENNIFRPLNYEPPLQTPDWTLIGTIIATDKSTATAYITERKTKRAYSVKEGEKIGEAIVKAIHPKQVTLDKNGKIVTLALPSAPLLSPTRSPQRSTYTPVPQQPHVVSEKHNAQSSPKNENDTERTAWREAQKIRIDELKKKAQTLKEIAAEQRQQMREYYPQ